MFTRRRVTCSLAAKASAFFRLRPIWDTKELSSWRATSIPLAAWAGVRDAPSAATASAATSRILSGREIGTVFAWAVDGCDGGAWLINTRGRRSGRCLPNRIGRIPISRVRVLLAAAIRPYTPVGLPARCRGCLGHEPHLQPPAGQVARAAQQAQDPRDVRLGLGDGRPAPAGRHLRRAGV